MRLPFLIFITLSILFLNQLVLRADDSLQALVRANMKALQQRDTLKIISSYRNMGDYLSECGEFAKADSVLKIAIPYCDKINELTKKGDIYNILGSNASYSGDRPLALSYYRKAMKTYADLRLVDDVAMVMMNIGIEYERLGDLKMALAYELKALDNKKRSKDQTNIDRYYQRIGQLFKESDPKKWEYYVRRAYEASLKLKETSVVNKVIIFNDLGSLEGEKKNFSAAIVWFDSMLYVAQQAGYENGIGTAYSNRALIYKSLKEYDKAYADVKEAIRYSELLNRNYSGILDKINAANILIEMKRYAEAKKYATLALERAKELKYYPDEEAQAHWSLSVAEEKLGNWKAAYVHLKAYKEGSDSIRSKEITTSNQELEQKYRTAEKEKEIIQLDDENKLKSIRLKQNRLLVYFLIIFVVLVAFVVIILYRRKQMVNRQQQVELIQKLLRSQMNPHFIFNTLNAISQFIQSNKSTEAVDYLARYSKLMRQILENSDADMISMENEIEFLVNYLKIQQLRFDNSFNYTVTVSDDIDVENFDIPPMLAQPIVENAIEHGVRGIKEGNITMHFYIVNNELFVDVEDNGRGISGENQDKPNNHKSYALRITKERLKNFGFSVDSVKVISPVASTGKGTKVTIQVPYKKYN